MNRPTITYSAIDIYNETEVCVGNTKTLSKKLTHPLDRTRYFIIGQPDFSIKKGDAIRYDGLPFVSRPRSFKDRETNSTYKPFKLDSGYWVLRKV